MYWKHGFLTSGSHTSSRRTFGTSQYTLHARHRWPCLEIGSMLPQSHDTDLLLARWSGRFCVSSTSSFSAGMRVAELPLIMRFVWLVPLFSTEAKPHTYNRGCSSWRSSSYPAQVIGQSELRTEDSSACARFQFADPVAAGEVWLCVWIPEPSPGIVALESPCQDH